MTPRVVIIGTSRSITQTAYATVLLNKPIHTWLMKAKGPELLEAIAALRFQNLGVVAGTGTGKTVLIRDVARLWLGKELANCNIDIVNSRSEEIPGYTHACEIRICTPEIALHWIERELLDDETLVVIDEIDNTSDELEFVELLIKLQPFSVLWLSATAEPTVFHRYFGGKLIMYRGFDPARQAKVMTTHRKPLEVLETILPEILQKREGVVVFLATRASTEQAADALAKRYPGLRVTYYHGGDNPEKLGKLMRHRGGPFVYFMTVIGAQAINIPDLTRIIIEDKMFREIIRGDGTVVLTKTTVDNNTLIHMIGRVHGRVIGGMVYICTERSKESFVNLKPVPIEFRLAANLERAALMAAKFRIDLTQAEVIGGGIDVIEFRKILARLSQRGVIALQGNAPSLTDYGREIDLVALGVRWSEIVLATVKKVEYAHLTDLVLLVGCVETLNSLVTEHPQEPFAVPGSDHLTIYNILASTLASACRFSRTPRTNRPSFEPSAHFQSWCEQNHFRSRTILDALVLIRATYWHLGRSLPKPEDLPLATGADIEAFAELLASTASLELHTANDAESVPLTSTLFKKPMLALGTRRYVDTKGREETFFEGTVIPMAIAKKFAKMGPHQFKSLKGGEARFTQILTFMGFPLGKPQDVKAPLEELDPSLLDGLYDYWATRLEQATTGNESLDAVARQNRDQLNRVLKINKMAQERLIEPSDLRSFYVNLLKGWDIRDVSSLSVEQVAAFQLAPLDEQLITETLRRHGLQEWVMVGDATMPIVYSKNRLLIQFSFEQFLQGDWIKLPNEGLFLPNGQMIVVAIAYAADKTHESADIAALKDKLATPFIRARWQNLSQDPPEGIVVYTDKTIDEGSRFPAILHFVYAIHPVSGEALAAYGILALRPKRAIQSYSPFEWRWFTDLTAAQEAHQKAEERFNLMVAIKAPEWARNRSRAQDQALREEATALVAELAQHNRYWRHRSMVGYDHTKGIPESIGILQSWLPDIRMQVADLRRYRQLEETFKAHQAYARSILEHYDEYLYQDDLVLLNSITSRDVQAQRPTALELNGWINTAINALKPFERLLIDQLADIAQNGSAEQIAKLAQLPARTAQEFLQFRQSLGI